jgi:hypothetical protein
MLDKFPFADSLPIKETAPPLPSPWVDNLFYYDQIKCLKALSKGKSWTWCEIRPDNIVSTGVWKSVVDQTNDLCASDWICPEQQCILSCTDTSIVPGSLPLGGGFRRKLSFPGQRQIVDRVVQRESAGYGRSLFHSCITPSRQDSWPIVQLRRRGDVMVVQMAYHLQEFWFAGRRSN